LRSAFLATLAHSLRKAGIKFYGGGRNNFSCKHIFSHLIETFVGADESTQRKLNCITAELLEGITSVAASAPDGSDSASNL
jgi:hypothetical protein